MDRQQLIIHLIAEEERINAEFVNGTLDRDTWTKEVQDVDDKLSILGLRLAHRPWEGSTTISRF